MNAPTAHQHLTPTVSTREVPAAMMAALQARFGDNCATGLAIREQHGRDESPFMHVPPPAAVVFAESTEDVADDVVARLYAYSRGSARMLVEGLLAAIKEFRKGRALDVKLVDAVAKQALCLQSVA